MEKNSFVKKEITGSQLNLKVEIIENFEGPLIGIYNNLKYGFSSDFKDYRMFNTGDDQRFIDWKLFARTDKPFVKMFENESNTDVYFFIDNTKSMEIQSEKSKYSKFDYLLILSGVLALFFLKNNDRLHFIYLKGDKPFVKSVYSADELFKISDDLVLNGEKGTNDFCGLIEKALEGVKNNSLSFVFSDVFEDETRVLNSFHKLNHRGTKPILMHILDNSEITFDMLQQFAEFVDPETNSKIFLTPGNLKNEYIKTIQLWISRIKKAVLTNRGSYFLNDTSVPIKNNVIAFLSELKIVKK